MKNHAMMRPKAFPSSSTWCVYERCSHIFVLCILNKNMHAYQFIALIFSVTEEKEDCDESFESLLQRAKYTLQLLRIAQHNERIQLQQQRQHVDDKSSPTVSSPRPNKLKKHQQQPQQLLKGETKTNQPGDDATSSTSSPISLQENQRTAMDVFLSSPTAVNWHDLVKSMRQDRDACESGRPRFSSSSRRDLMNLIETITVYTNMDGLDDDDDHSSVTLSLPSESQQTSQSQQSLEDDQRKAMESFLSSPTGLNWDDFVTSLGRDDERGRSTAKNRKETMPTQNTAVDVKPSLLSTRWKLKQFKQQNHNQSSPSTRDRSKKSKGAKSLERRIEQILTSSPTSAIVDTTSHKAAGNVGSEMILHDLMTIDEDIALTPKRH